MEYVGELIRPPSVGGEPKAPGYYSDMPTQTIVSQTRLCQVDFVTGVVPNYRDLPDGVLLAPNSLVSIVDQGSTERLYCILSAQGDVLTMDPQRNTIVYVSPPFWISSRSSSILSLLKAVTPPSFHHRQRLRRRNIPHSGQHRNRRRHGKYLVRHRGHRQLLPNREPWGVATRQHCYR